MDASKALQALREGRLFDLPDALDPDASMIFEETLDCGVVARIAAYRFGNVLLTVDAGMHPHELPHLEISAWATVLDTVRAFTRATAPLLAERQGYLMTGQPVGRLWINGVEITQAATPIHDQLVMATVVIPDDVRELTGE